MARIRTIKPEFWQNEKLARLSEHARLLAIALLNHADDEGYFNANAFLVRAACFPYDDNSTKVIGSLKELSQIGYIETRSDGEKHLGRVCKFLLHQRIDKPGSSKFRDAFDSLDQQNAETLKDSATIPRTLPDYSTNTPRLEQGTGNREGNRESGKWKLEQGLTTSAETKTPPAQPRISKAKFEPPTVEEIEMFCLERRNNVDAEALWAHYQSNGWKQSNGNAIKDWRACVITWEKNDERFSKRGTVAQTFTQQRQENTKDAITEFVNGV
jgi:hypothetical protein